MFRNVASQKIQLFAFDTATGLPKTGDAANLTAYVSKDHGTVTALTDTSATEMSSTNSPGAYLFDLTQGETDFNEGTFSGKSSTSGVTVVPRFVTTFPATGILAPATAGRTLVVDAAGLADANVVKVGPSGSGTAQTAGDLAARLPAALVGGRIDATVDGTGMEAGATAAIRDAVLLRTTASGVVGSGSTTANVVASSVAVGATTSLSADAWKGRVIIFNSDTTTAALRGQAAAIVSHTSGSTPTFTLATGAWTTAPLSGDTFTVV